MRSGLRRIVLATFALVILATAGLMLPPPVQAQQATGPDWGQLSPQEREILAPLASDWNRLDAQRRVKWRGIAQRYSRMSPDEQARVQEQMRPWAQLSPQERAAARERYKSLRNLPPDQRNDVRQRWEEYRSLPPETRKELADRAPPATAGTRAPPRGQSGGSASARPDPAQRNAAPPPSDPGSRSQSR